MRLMKAGEAAELLQVTLQRIYEMARTGMIPCVRMGWQVRFDEAALREWVSCGGSVEKRHPPLRE
jgi:excisionase family DNA binding protein